ncbi:DEAD/DEAH box helicase [bacterium]|nr:DEAD/DEAH box helicase [bacterium]
MGLLDKIKSMFTGGDKPAGKKDDKRGRDGRKGEAGRSDGQRESREGQADGGARRGGRNRRRRPPREQGESTERTQKTEHDKSMGGQPKSPGQSRHRSRGRGRGRKDGAPGQGAGQTQDSAAGSQDSQAEAAETSRQRGDSYERDSSGSHLRARGKKRSRPRRGKSSELGGTAQRIEFPELLEVTEQSEEVLGNEFRPLGLSDRLVLTLAANRFRIPTDIQREMIPEAIRGRDILGQAKTGTGKTIAFLMPIFERVDPTRAAVQALIVVPTRELCRQVTWEAQRFGRTLEARVMSVYGGTSVSREVEALRISAPQIMVGTPGRLLDHIGSGNVNLSELKTLVLDEADRMFDIGFRQDIIRIIKACPDKRQIMLLSATLDSEVEELSERYMTDPVQIYVSKDEITVESIWQRIISAERGKKIDKLIALLRREMPTQSIIFTNTKRMSDSLSLRLEKLGFKARCIHSDLSQNKRERIMDDFRTGGIEHLVATDVAARGLDITGISHVINYDVPANPEDYVHRVGRTGRMGSAGKAFTFVTPTEGKELTQIEKLINKMLGEYDPEAHEQHQTQPQPAGVGPQA